VAAELLVVPDGTNVAHAGHPRTGRAGEVRA
jgi:hypothetical protein